MSEPIRKRPLPGWLIAIIVTTVIALLALGTWGLIALFGDDTPPQINGQPQVAPSTAPEQPSAVATPGNCAVNASNLQMPEWHGDACQYTGDALGLLTRGSNKSSIATPGYELIMPEELSSVPCNREQITGAEQVWLQWCIEGYFVGMKSMITKSMNQWGEDVTFGAISASYGAMALIENNQPYSAGNAACVAGEVISSLNDLGVLPTEKARKIQEAYFYDESEDEPENFRRAYIRELTYPLCII